LQDLEQVCLLGPGAIGFVFWSKSRRYVRPEQVASWEPYIPAPIKKVGVFVDPTSQEIEEAVSLACLDVAQVHLTSNDWKIDEPAFHGLELWLAPRFERGFVPKIVEQHQPEPSVVVVDSYDPKTIGGTGKVADWDAAHQIVQVLQKPVLLAGGLNATNVAEAIATVQPWGVDVSSGVEKEPGVKDIRKVKRFLDAARI